MCNLLDSAGLSMLHANTLHLHIIRMPVIRFPTSNGVGGGGVVYSFY